MRLEILVVASIQYQVEAQSGRLVRGRRQEHRRRDAGICGRWRAVEQLAYPDPNAAKDVKKKKVSAILRGVEWSAS